MDWLRRRLSSRTPARTNADRENVSSWEFDRLRHGRCPDCGGCLYAGPEGGMSVNVACDKCGSEFNLSPVMAHRNSVKGSPDLVRLRQVFGIDLAKK